MESELIHYKVEDFLKDNDFISYVFERTGEAVSRWETLFKMHPYLEERATEAMAILLALEDVVTDLVPPEIAELKERIFKTLKI
ncbi:MAG: hypothetical protein LUE93_12625 [Bacteroides sp.]|nr:hypothetical protein [Bacteroides sp.]